MLKKTAIYIVNKAYKKSLEFLFFRRKILAKSNAFLCSFPKSGRTWVRFFLINYLSQIFNHDIEVNFDNSILYTPSIKNRKSIKFAEEKLEKDLGFLIFSSHEIFNKNKMADSKIILIIRSLFDVIISLYFHKYSHHQTYIGSIQDFVRSESLSLVPIIEYYEGWVRAIKTQKIQNKNLLLIRYEDLRDDNYKGFKDILTFLGIEVNEQILRSSILKSSFDSMKTIERIKRDSDSRDDNDSMRVRRGLVGGYKEYLGSEDIFFIKSFFEKRSSQELKSFFAKYKINV